MEFPIRLGKQALTKAQFLTIKELRENGENGTKIAEQFGLSRILIYAFFKEWKILPKREQEIIISNKRFSQKHIENIFQRRMAGETVNDIAVSLDVDPRRLGKVFQKYKIRIRVKNFQKIGGKLQDKEKFQQICKRRLEGEKIKELAKEFELNENALVHFFLRHNIRPSICSRIVKEPEKLIVSGHKSKLKKLMEGNIKSVRIGGRDLTIEKVNSIIEQRKKGLLLQRISNETGIDRRALQYFFAREGIQPEIPPNEIRLGSRLLTYEEIEDLKKGRLNGESIRAIGGSSGINNVTLCGFFKKENICPAANLLRNINRTYQINHDFFINTSFSSANEAYILGLIITDGSIDPHDKTIEICLKRDDIYLLEKVNALLGSNRPIFLPNIKNDNRARLRVSSTQIFTDLKRKGIDPSTKSSTARYPNLEILPEQFQGAFIRGVFDGDGWVSVNKEKKNFSVGFIGTKDLLEGIQAVLVTKCRMNKSTISTRSKAYVSCFSMQYRGRQNLMKFYDFLYGRDFNPDRDLCLRRKWEKMNSANVS